MLTCWTSDWLVVTTQHAFLYIELIFSFEVPVNSDGQPVTLVCGQGTGMCQREQSERMPGAFD